MWIDKHLQPAGNILRVTRYGTIMDCDNLCVPDPCEHTSCPNHPTARCYAYSRSGRCIVEYYLNGNIFVPASGQDVTQSCQNVPTSDPNLIGK